MTGFNRGEWSELLAILSLISNPKLKIVDENLRFLRDDIFKVIDIITPDLPSKELNFVAEESSKDLFWEIISAPTGEGSFSIKSTEHDCEDLLETLRSKGNSSQKADVVAEVEDLSKNSIEQISYSIKSMLGSPATLLNSSSATNFEYLVSGLDEETAQRINSISTRTKLKDRLKVIDNLGGKVFFSKISNSIFESNLLMVDSLMPEILACVLLDSYRGNTKDLLELFISSGHFRSKQHAVKKLNDLLQAISFGMFPNKVWDGTFEVNGGILVVKPTGDVGLLDLIYHNEIVGKFLTKETKLDSPSSSRYHMLELTPSNEDQRLYKFTLNLQIRYKH